MKTTIDIPEKLLMEAIRHTGARTKKEAILTAVEKFNRLKRLEALNARIRGTFKDFIIAACAVHYKLELEFCDARFDRILPIAAKR